MVHFHQTKSRILDKYNKFIADSITLLSLKKLLLKIICITLYNISYKSDKLIKQENIEGFNVCLLI